MELEVAIAGDDAARSRVTREQILMAMDMPHFDLARATAVAVDGRGRIAAQGRAVVPPGDDRAIRARLGGGVRPDLRRQGIGSRLLDWQVAVGTRALESARPPAGAAGRVPASLTASVRADDAGTAVLLASRGFAPTRSFAEMHRDLAVGLPVRSLPGRLRMVPVSPVWWERMRDCRNAAFRDHWGIAPVPRERWEGVLALPSSRPDLSFLAVEGRDPDARVVGLVLVDVVPDRSAAGGSPSAYIDTVGVLRGFRGEGVAQALLAAALAAIRAEGMTRAVLDVDSASPTGALRLYEHLGFIRASGSTVHERPLEDPDTVLPG